MKLLYFSTGCPQVSTGKNLGKVNYKQESFEEDLSGEGPTDPNEEDNTTSYILEDEKKKLDTVHRANDDSEKLDDDKDFLEKNEELEEKYGPLTDNKGGHVDFNDIWFEECEEEKEFGISNIFNLKCKKDIEEFNKRKTEKKHTKKDITNRANSKWQNPLPYLYHKAEMEPESERFVYGFNAAVAEISGKSCITFREKIDADDSYIRFNQSKPHRGRYGGIRDVVTEDGSVIRRETMTPVDPTVIELGNGRYGGRKPMHCSHNERYCNEPKTHLNDADLITVTKRWMRIFERYFNDEFADQLIYHLEKIYPVYDFLVGSSSVLSSRNQDARSGYCIRVANHVRNTFVCYTRKQGREFGRRKEMKIRRAIKRAVNRKMCKSRARDILDIAKEAIKQETYQKVAGIYVLLYRYNLQSDWSENARSIRVNFKCRNERYSGSVSVLFK